MDVNSSTETRNHRIIEVNGITFDARNLAKELGFLRSGEWKGYNDNTLRKMKRAGLVRMKYVRDSHDMSITGKTWEQVDRKCKELFDELNEPYSKWRVSCGYTQFGPWDESEVENAKERAMEKKRELEERNPDVEWRLNKEELAHIPIE